MELAQGQLKTLDDKVKSLTSDLTADDHAIEVGRTDATKRDALLVEAKKKQATVTKELNHAQRALAVEMAKHTPLADCLNMPVGNLPDLLRGTPAKASPAAAAGKSAEQSQPVGDTSSE